MIETETSWEDSGYDCDHCGGEISKRIDRESGQPDRTCYQCRQCGCQWDLGGDALRVGSGTYCKSAQRQRVGTKPEEILLSRRFLIIAGIILLLVIARFGGITATFALFRFLLPLALLAYVVHLAIRHGREQKWW